MRGLMEPPSGFEPLTSPLVQMGVAAYCRYLYYNRMIHHSVWENCDLIQRVQATSFFAKEVDRSFRQYNAMVTYLENKKNGGKMNVKLTANTAFIAQNQQNIAGSNDTKTINDEQ